MNLNKASNKAMPYFLDWVGWLFAFLFCMAIFFVNFYFSNQASWLLIVENIVAVMFVLGFASLTQKGRVFWGFVKEARIEMHRIVWPTQKETLQSALVVIIVVLVAALFLWAVDNVLMWALNFFVGQRG